MNNIKLGVDNRAFTKSLLSCLEKFSPKYLVSVAESCLSGKTPSKPFKIPGKISFGEGTSGTFKGNISSYSQPQLARLISNFPSEIRGPIAKKAVILALSQGGNFAAKAEAKVSVDLAIALPVLVSRDTMESVSQGGIKVGGAIQLKRHLLRLFARKSVRLSSVSTAATLIADRGELGLLVPTTAGVTLLQQALRSMDTVSLKRLDAKLTDVILSGLSGENA